MAVSIMSARCRASLLCLQLSAWFLQVSSQGQVFHQAPQAHDVFLRSKRANMFLLEEILQGNLERECYEERCNFEEAREFFEDTKKTIAFWTVYLDGDQCKPNPCLYGGNCTDMVGGFQCTCTPPHHGQTCELGGAKELREVAADPPQHPIIIPPEIAECPTEGPAACQQLCTASYRSFVCSCMPGFKLQSDRRSCLPEVEFPCGRSDNFSASLSMCRHGNCPWQVSLLNSSGLELCGGVVLGQRSVLTTAHCVLPYSGSELQPSDLFVTAGNHKTLASVQDVEIHERFRPHHRDNDLALLQLASPLTFGPDLIQLCLPTKDFSENILMHSGKTGVFKQTEGTDIQDLVYMSLDDCRSQLNVSHPLSNKMFCMRRENGDTEKRSGAPEMASVPVRDRNEPHRRGFNRAHRPHGPSRIYNGTPRSLRNHLERDHGMQRRVDIDTGNLNETRLQRRPDGAEGQNSSSEDPLDDSGRKCGSPLPGAPVATVEQGTAFLTGLMISSSSGCDSEGGLVFTKLSRYLSWIKPKLESAEGEVPPHIRKHPKNR